MESRMRSAGTVATLVLCALSIASGALAAPYTYPLNYTTVSGTGVASGSITFDDSVLAAGGTHGILCNTSDIISLTLNVTGMSGSPTTTTFSKSDISGWVLTLAAGQAIADLNYFSSSPCASASNPDGFTIDGIDPLLLGLHAPTGAPVAEFQVLGQGIPTLSPWGLVALAALLAAAGAIALRRLA